MTTKQNGDQIEPEESKEDIEEKQSKFIKTINIIYDKATSGMTGTDIPPAQKLALKYLNKYDNDKYLSSKNLIKTQYYKTFSTGFLSGLGGWPLLPLSLPADLTSSLFIEMRMIAAIAYIGGYKIESKKVRTLTFMCLLGGGVKKMLKGSGIKVGQKITKNLIAKVPEKVFVEINKKVGIQLFSKIGSKGLIGTTRAIPIMGGFIGGGVNIYFTNGVGNRALETFIIDGLSEEDIKKYNINLGPKISTKEKIMGNIKKIHMPKFNFRKDTKKEPKKEDDFGFEQEKADDGF